MLDYSTKYRVTYKHGLMNTSEVYASDPITAAKMGLAEYRKHATITDDFKLEDVVDTVTLITDKSK